MRRNPYDWTELVMDAVYSEPTVVRTAPAAVGVVSFCLGNCYFPHLPNEDLEAWRILNMSKD